MSTQSQRSFTIRRADSNDGEAIVACLAAAFAPYSNSYTPAAFTDPARGAELTRSQVAEGADVVLQAAGQTGLGVLRAAADAHILGIGSDSDQNGLFPGQVLTSLLKRTDNAVYLALEDAQAGRWKPGARLLGLAEGGLDVAIDDANRKLVTQPMQEAVDKARAAIVAGTLVVPDWTATRSCPP